MGAGPVSMGFLVGPNGELGNMAVHRAFYHVEADVAAPGAALLGADQRQIDRICDKVRVEQEALLLALWTEVIGLPGETVLEIVVRVENELDIVELIDHDGAVRDRDVTRRLLSRPIEMLMPGVERDRE